MPHRAPLHGARHGRGAERGTACARGYDRRWRKLRAAFLLRHPLCLWCEEHGTTTAAAEVDHIERIVDRPDLRLEWSNLRALCRVHHEERHSGATAGRRGV
ncbi:MAG TPA: HNH endonuclease signature motif containing protein [Acetobacteraceae bacterium]|nr:HNH endonuclease signature motif containing protein [Acetobacteraceae bacterium]